MIHNKKRLLAAIMFTDIVGYTKMMQENERSSAIVRQRHRKVFQKKHEQYHGEILQYYGDGTLSIFKSAVEAVQCATAMQQAFLSDQPVPLRIGIHLGDIVFDQQDVYGDGVNLASRIESMGVAGSILISDKLNDAIKSQDFISTISVGIYEFKSIDKPIEIFAVANSGIRVPVRSEMKGKLKQSKKSIAVLPFVNMSSDPENEYFSDGISEEILNGLVRVEGIHVTARTSSFMFKGKNLDIRDIGLQLGVTHVLEGSVRKFNNRIRVTAQLISSIDGFHFFSETYDRVLEDVFLVQDEIAQKITNRFKIYLEKDNARTNIVQASTDNIEAYDTYLRGLYYLNKWGDEELNKAIPLFLKAIEMQSDFALPYAKLSFSYIIRAFQRRISWQEAKEKTEVFIQRTIELDADSPEAYLSIFVYQFFIKWDWQAATQVIKKGLKLYPNYASLYHALSALYYLNGNKAAALRSHRQGYKLNPLSIEMIFYMGVGHFWNKEYEEANNYFEKILRIKPNYRTALEYKGWYAIKEKRFDEAMSYFNKMTPQFGYHMHSLTSIGWLYIIKGDIEKAESCLKELEDLQIASDDKYGLSFDLAALHANLGNFDEAFMFLEQAIENKIADSMMVRIISLFDPLRIDPRFSKIEELVGLADLD